jgi:hypothetical protein
MTSQPTNCNAARKYLLREQGRLPFGVLLPKLTKEGFWQYWHYLNTAQSTLAECEPAHAPLADVSIACFV